MLPSRGGSLSVALSVQPVSVATHPPGSSRSRVSAHACPHAETDSYARALAGGGGRGQKAKDYLLANGFKNVANGGGPEDTECWAVFGSK